MEIQSKKIVKIFNLLLEVSWLLIIGLIPILINRSIQTLEIVWIINSSALIQTLVEFMLIVWLAKLFLVFKDKEKRLYKAKSSFFEIAPILSAIIFIFIFGLAALFSQAPGLSFRGSYFGETSFLLYLHLLIFYLVLIFNLNSWNKVKRILITILISSGIVSLYGVFQAFGFDPIAWKEPPFLAKRIFSFFGQPNFLASWLLFVIPVSLFVCVYFKKLFLKRFLIFLLTGFLFYNLIYTYSRAAWLGFLAQIIFVLFVYGCLGRKKLIFSAVLIIVLLSSGFIYFNFLYHPDSPYIEEITITSRLKTLVYPLSTAASNIRMALYKTAVEAIKERPILGYGPEAQGIAFVKHYQTDNLAYQLPNTYPSRAHNDILDMLLASGFLGLFSYLFFIGSVFYYGWRKLNQPLSKRYRNLIIVLLAGLFGYLVSIQFSFHIIQTTVYFWLFMAMVIALGNGHHLMTTVNKSETIKISKTLIFGFIFLIIFIFYSIYLINIKMVLADYHLKQATKNRVLENQMAMIENYQKAIKYQPQEPFYRQLFALDLMKFTEENFTYPLEIKLKFLQTADDFLEEIPISERYFEILWLQTRIQLRKASLTRASEDFFQAEESFKQLTKKFPKIPGPYTNWCQLKMYEKDWLVAQEMCKKAFYLYPDLKNSQIGYNQRQIIIIQVSQIYNNLGEIYLALGNYEKAESMYRQILKFYPLTRTDLWKKLGDIYY
ncbi:O-antigen ligase family protein, partial [Patescibacteria group bacterium]|nr:O-antigen ligase family protein [Patescibacteria group bacterium]